MSYQNSGSRFTKHENASTQSKRQRAWGLAVGLLLICFGQMAAAAPRLSLTADEPVYITAGLAYLRTGDLRFQPAVQHPPLMCILSAWPILLRPGTPAIQSVAGWDEIEQSRFIVSLFPQLGPVQATVFAGRVPVMWLSLLLAAFVYRWAADWGKHTAGLAALGLYAFDPNLLAHGSLATTDLGLTAFIFAASYGLMRFLGRPTRSSFLLAGIGLGLAMAAKTSGAFLAAVFALILAVHEARRPAQAIRYLLGLGGLASLVVWGLYSFELQTPPGWPLPLPAATYWLQLADFGNKAAGGQTAFLMGQISQHGWWSYYPIAFALKTPISMLIVNCQLLMVNCQSLITKHLLRTQAKMQGTKHPAQPAKRWLVLGAFPVLYGAGLLLSSFNTGYRFLLPILPFVFVWVGVQVSGLKFQVSGSLAANARSQVSRVTFHVSRVTFYVLLLWYVIGTIRIFPHYLAYFNELAGGPDGGYRYLVDSNLDWGQTLIGLKSYMDRHNIDRVNISQFTYTDPAWYGIDYQALAPMRGAPPVMPSRFNPPPGWYAIGATTLQGVAVADSEQFDWFRQHAPEARLGHALFVYHVPDPAVRPAWVAQCTQPVAPLDEAEIAAGFRTQGTLRTSYFDCTQSWLAPPGSGWYVLSPDAQSPRGGPAGLELVYRQTRPGRVPPFNVYLSQWPSDQVARWSNDQVISETTSGQTVVAAPGDWPPAQAERDGQRVTIPVTLDGPLILEGYTLSASKARPGESLEMVTLWRVTANPARPLSLMAHLLDAAGHPVAVGDGLGVPVEFWQPGDLIAQRHKLSLPPDTAPGSYRLQTGAYWLDTLERQAVMADGRVVGDRLLLFPIKVYH
ncbi:MAG: glycosyltransferase family 39 protein [Thermoflexales bacterium]|nr:glycosyltransferase family 39 protein [Thermoflexales bacterium]